MTSAVMGTPKGVLFLLLAVAPTLIVSAASALLYSLLHAQGDSRTRTAADRRCARPAHPVGDPASGLDSQGDAPQCLCRRQAPAARARHGGRAHGRRIEARGIVARRY